MKPVVTSFACGILLLMIASACTSADAYVLEGKWVEIDTGSDLYKINEENSVVTSKSSGQFHFVLTQNGRTIAGQFEQPMGIPFYFDSDTSGKRKINTMKSQNVLLNNALSVDLISEVEDIGLGRFQRESAIQ